MWVDVDDYCKLFGVGHFASFCSNETAIARVTDKNKNILVLFWMAIVGQFGGLEIR